MFASYCISLQNVNQKKKTRNNNNAQRQAKAKKIFFWKNEKGRKKNIIQELEGIILTSSTERIEMEQDQPQTKQDQHIEVPLYLYQYQTSPDGRKS